jgi:hypothetical protein
MKKHFDEDTAMTNDLVWTNVPAVFSGTLPLRVVECDPSRLFDDKGYSVLARFILPESSCMLAMRQIAETPVPLSFFQLIDAMQGSSEIC